MKIIHTTIVVSVVMANNG